MELSMYSLYVFEDGKIWIFYRSSFDFHALLQYARTFPQWQIRRHRGGEFCIIAETKEVS
jgi:hypothetical protein